MNEILTKPFAVFGTGFVAEMFREGLKNRGLERNAKLYLVSGEPKTPLFHGVPVMRLADCEDRSLPVCIAVHEANYPEVQDLLTEAGFRTYFIYPGLYDLIYGDALREERMTVEELLQRQDPAHYWLAVRMLGATGNEALYRKAIALHAGENTAGKRWERLQELKRSFEENGYDENHPVFIDEDGRIIDGLHRIVLAYMNGTEEIPCRIYHPSESYGRLLKEKNYLPETCLSAYGFTDTEIAELRKAQDMIMGIRKKRVLVTGGAGFIGAHLCRRLLAEGNEVICLDDLSTGRMSNIEELMEDPSFTFVKHDVIEPYDYKVDEIYNLACPASPPHYQKDPVRTMMTCVLGARSALELARKYSARILQASTSEVYGDPEEHPQKETYRGSVNPVGPRSCYDEGKRAAEALFFDYHRMYGTDIRVIRIFNTYGPMMDPEDGRVVSNLIEQALKGEPLTVYGDGKQTRSFCYVSDLIEGMVRMMAQEEDCGPVNLGNPEETTIKDTAEAIREIIGTDPEICYRELPEDDPHRRRPDITRARELLNWQPEVPLAEGLKVTAEYFRRLKQ